MGSSNPATISNVFVYGSLLSDDVVCALLSRVPPSFPATLPDFHRFSIKERVYPAIIPVENKKVIGKVLIGITPPELYILDTFEDVEYERKTVDVLLNVGHHIDSRRRKRIGSCLGGEAGACYITRDGSEKLQADTYVWQNKTDPNLYGEWDFEGWKQLHFEDFLKMTTEFKEELELPYSKTRVATYESFYQEIAKNH